MSTITAATWAVTSSRQVGKPSLERVHHRLRSVCRIEFSEDMLDVVLHCSQCQMQGSGDLLIALSGDHQIQYLPLSLAQLRLAQPLCQTLTNGRGNVATPAMRKTNGVQQFRVGSVFEEIGLRSGLQPRDRCLRRCRRW